MDDSTRICTENNAVMTNNSFDVAVKELIARAVEEMTEALRQRDPSVFFQVAHDQIIQFRKKRMQRWVWETFGPIVQTGPFKGMRYLDIDEFEAGHFYAPKILGTIEQDLHPYLWDLSKYDHVINVGCAEGYYAVGPLTCSPRSRVTAFDIVPEERERCERLAALNGVSDRLTVLGECTSSYLEENCTSGSLVIMDIEGAETELLRGCDPGRLRGDLIVECHDVNGASTQGPIVDFLSGTHGVTVVRQTFPDISEIGELAEFRQLDRFLSIWEGRGPWPWIVAQSP
jgi:hypothetical protein